MSEKKSNTSAQKSGGGGKLEKTVKIASAVLADCNNICSE